MTVAKQMASPVYFGTVLRPPSLPASTKPRVQSRQSADRSTANRLLEGLLTLLIAMATAASMWFVVTDGWFRLFGFWGR